jgi:purine-binding chemotaxis protein CheW
MSAEAGPIPEPRNEGHLSFLLGSEEYAVEILRVREIRSLCPITPIPNAPPHVRGVMNLRGAVVTVVDLRTALGLAAVAYDKFTVIVVLTVGEKRVGVVVDSVCDVLSIDTAQVQPVPDMGVRAGLSGVRGICRVGDRLVSLLDVERILTAERDGS